MYLLELWLKVPNVEIDVTLSAELGGFTPDVGLSTDVLRECPCVSCIVK